MATNTTGSIRHNMRRASDKGRGEIYRWLKKHHRTIKAGFARTDASWDSIVATMLAEGVRGRGDVDPNRKTVSKIWSRVCRDLEEQATQARRAARSRPAGTWSPPTRVSAPRPETRQTGNGSGRVAPASKPAPKPQITSPAADAPKPAEDPFAVVRRQMAYIDRHIVRSSSED